MQKKKHLLLKTMILILGTIFCHAEQVDFYATVSSSEDTAMIKMTTDLFYTKFMILDGYTVNDMRSLPWTRENHRGSTSFYVQVEEDSDGGWICTLTAIKPDGIQNVSSTKKYDTYYKILMDSKASLENLMLNLTMAEGNAETAIQEPEAQPQPVENSTAAGPASPSSEMMDSIAGTWTGEELIEKILILRGGRGFVIFKNGARMNISISPQNGTNLINIIQNGKSNASFFPELQREAALKLAPTAEPVEWEMMLQDESLVGIKKTLVEDKKSPSGYSRGQISVKWTKER
ncbi:MAG: hypothetical protein MJZ50_00850 [Treponema sp.]|nr:hypothetical protein [Treponema sp.]